VAMRYTGHWINMVGFIAQSDLSLYGTGRVTTELVAVLLCSLPAIRTVVFITEKPHNILTYNI